MEKILGKIKTIKLGVQDGRFGLWLTLEGERCGVGTHEVYWDPETIKVDEYTKWTEEDRDKQLSDIMRKVSKLLKEAKVSYLKDLTNKPVEITFDDKRMLKDWRILTEVL